MLGATHISKRLLLKLMAHVVRSVTFTVAHGDGVTHQPGFSGANRIPSAVLIS